MTTPRNDKCSTCAGSGVVAGRAIGTCIGHERCKTCVGSGIVDGDIDGTTKPCFNCLGRGEHIVVQTGVKYDSGKPELSLLFSFGQVLDAIVAVCKYGAKKYPDITNWQRVENGEQRYTDACLRHLRQHLQNEPPDVESNLPHIYHFAWNALAATWHAMQKTKTVSNAPFKEGDHVDFCVVECDSHASQKRGTISQIGTGNICRVNSGGMFYDLHVSQLMRIK